MKYITRKKGKKEEYKLTRGNGGRRSDKNGGGTDL
jgi:hypothetical protein